MSGRHRSARNFCISITDPTSLNATDVYLHATWSCAGLCHADYIAYNSSNQGAAASLANVLTILRCHAFTCFPIVAYGAGRCSLCP